MADKLGARQDSSFKAISTAPDICKTPMGNTVVPIPYPIVSDLSQSIQTVPKVRFNGKPCYVLDQSIVPTCTGDEPGTAMGVRSGTNKGKTEPKSGSSSVRAGKKKVVRERDTCTMNNGNTNGIFVTQPSPGCKCSKGKPTKDTNPPPKDETKKEKTFKEKLGEWWDNTKKEVKEAVKHPVEGAKGAAKGTANIVPELGEVFTKSSMLDTANQMDQAAGFQELFGNAEKAKEYSDAATSMRSGVDSVNLPKFDMSNAAQAGGDKIFTAVTLITGLYGLAKSATKIGVKGTAKLGAKAEKAAVKEVSTVARENKAIENATNEASAVEKVASRGDGVKIKKKGKPRVLSNLSKEDVRNWLKKQYPQHPSESAERYARRIEDHVNSIDWNKPVKLVEFSPGDKILMYVREGGKPGGYGTIPGTSAEKLGLNLAEQPRNAITQTVKFKFQAVESTAAEFPTGKYPGIGGAGGGTQYQLPSEFLTYCK